MSKNFHTLESVAKEFGVDVTTIRKRLSRIGQQSEIRGNKVRASILTTNQIEILKQSYKRRIL
jgi:predicted DNA binding protein